ncbi:type II secretion system protein N [Sphingomonas qomolangmaensis]|uniref:Signaling protein n=1 Tax=Sphingomonas qomolangmaensis TaxID=2918765 RepID=A0ABY5LDY3_9SPHN|nr:type II secretion system protein N [Sphingomonas qomolangmaensis]UUL83939.1 signaling protein [Sphingomonas qomolangmaensis]
MNRLIIITPRQSKLAIDLFTAGMVASVAWALAGLTWRIAGHAGQGAITVPSGTRPVSVAPDIAPALALAPFGKAAQVAAAQATGLQIALKGVVFAVPASFSVAYISNAGEAAKPFRIGDGIGGATIEGIQRDRVLLNNAGRTEFLAFPDPAAGPAPAPGAPPAPGAAPAAAPPAPAPAPQAAASLLQRFDATPTEGGYAVGQNAPPGMQPGDVVQSVNGQALGRGPADQAAFAAAARSGSAQIQVVRDGKPVTLTVPLR